MFQLLGDFVNVLKGTEKSKCTYISMAGGGVGPEEVTFKTES